MGPSSYSWSCHNCGHSNEPDTDTCTSCGCPALVSSANLEAFRAGTWAPPTKKKSASKSARIKRPAHLKFALFFLWAGFLAIPITVFLTYQFGTRGYGGPGGWGTGGFILAFGIAGISPTLIISAGLAFFCGEFAKKGNRVLAAFFGLLLVAMLVVLGFEVYMESMLVIE